MKTRASELKKLPKMAAITARAKYRALEGEEAWSDERAIYGKLFSNIITINY